MSGEAIESTIEVSAITADTMFTCNVQVPDGTFTEDKEIKVFGNFFCWFWFWFLDQHQQKCSVIC